MPYPDWAPGSKITAKRMLLHARQLDYFESEELFAWVTLASIPQTYQDLILVIRARGDANADQVGTLVQMNSVNSGYSVSLLQDFNTFAAGDSTKVGPWYLEDQSGFHGSFAPAGLSAGGTYSTTEVVIPGYATTRPKQALTQGGYLDGANHFMSRALSHNPVTAPVASLDIRPSSGNWAVGSTFTLYAR